MALNEFLDFMRDDIEGKSSPMVSFLSKRAKLMINFSIELLSQYLKVLRDSSLESRVDVQKFLEDISDNLEYFKQEEVAIREEHFNYFEESEKLKSVPYTKEMFSPEDLSQLHAVNSSDR
jgi:hypothetical protein